MGKKPSLVTELLMHAGPDEKVDVSMFDVVKMVKQARKDGTIPITYLENMRDFGQYRANLTHWLSETGKLIEHLELDLENDPNAEHRALLDEVKDYAAQKNKTREIINRFYEWEGTIAPVALKKLRQFDFDELEKKQQDAYFDDVIIHDKYRNPHIAIEIYQKFVAWGMNPPAWVLQMIGIGLTKFLKDPDREPKKLGKCLGLEGASGTTPSWAARKAEECRHRLVFEMMLLISEFGLSINRAASLVKLKHQLSESNGTIRRWHREAYGSETKVITEAKHDTWMNEYDRTKFIASYPPRARRYLNK